MSETAKSDKKPTRNLTVTGFALTAVYAIIVISLILSGWIDFSKLDSSGRIEFISGAFSPPAFIWLVIGYFQQGFELRQNSRALQMQAEELEKLVNNQRDLINIEQERDSRNLERQNEQRQMTEVQASPRIQILKYELIHDDINKAYLRCIGFENFGANCTNFKITASGPSGIIDQKTMNSLNTGDAFDFIYKIDPLDGSEHRLNCSYIDGLLRGGGCNFVASGLGPDFSVRTDS